MATNALQDLKLIAEAFYEGVGEHLIESLAAALGKTTGIDFILAGQFARDRRGRIRTLAVWKQGSAGEGLVYDLESVPDAGLFRQPQRGLTQAEVRQLLPAGHGPESAGMNSAVGTLLADSLGRPLGVLLGAHSGPIRQRERCRYLFEILGSRMASELERMQFDEQTLDQIAPG